MCGHLTVANIIKQQHRQQHQQQQQTWSLGIKNSQLVGNFDASILLRGVVLVPRLLDHLHVLLDVLLVLVVVLQVPVAVRAAVGLTNR